MSLVFEKLLSPAIEVREPKLNIAVVFTSVEQTLTALKKAGQIAKDLNASITLIVPQVVPYPLPLTSPPVLLAFNERRFRVIAGEGRVQTTVRIYLCRDRVEMLQSVLAPRSIVVIGMHRSWWLSGENRLVRRLRRAGHELIAAF